MPIDAARPGSLRDVPLDGRGPAYDQIYRSLRHAILAGRAAPGTALPATRRLALDLGVSRTTILGAYDQLLAEGYVVARRGSGTFVAEQVPAPASRRPSGTPKRRNEPPIAPQLSHYGRRLLGSRPRAAHEKARAQDGLRFDFRPCVPELERLSSDGWRRTLARRALHAPEASFDYADPAGSPALRRELASYLGRARGVVCDADSISIVAGVSQALDLAARLFLDRGDTVLVEDPGYLGARRCFDAAGAKLAPGPVDDQGLRLGDVDRSLLERCRLAYVTPSHQFPTGAVMSLPRRLALLRWAETNGTYILEDDYDSEFRYEGRAIEPLKSLDSAARVIYVGTFAKTLFPSMRIAYLVLPDGLRELFRDAKWLADFASPTLEQDALADFLASGDFERHTRRARTLYGRSRAALLDALHLELGDEALVRDSHAGLHVHVRLPNVPHRSFGALRARALEHEVGIYSAGHCYLQPPAAAELVLGFTRLEETAIREGVSRLAALIGDFSE